MRTKLVYEDFRRSAPSEEIQKKHQKARSQMLRARLQQYVERGRVRRAESATYHKALGEFLATQPAFTRIPLRAHRHHKTEFQAEPQAHPILGKRIFRTGSCHTIDTPSAEPFVSWIDPAPPATSSNNAAGGGSSDSARGLVTLGVSAGWDEQVGGTAACWGYMGRYFTPPANLPALNSLNPAGEAWLAVAASPSVQYTEDWSTTFFEYANLTLSVNLWVPIYSLDWSEQVGEVASEPATIYAVATNSGSSSFPDSVEPFGPFSYPISLLTAISGNFNYGIFVQFYAYAEAGGQSPGYLVPGSVVSGGLQGTLSSIQINVEEWSN
jgi:hypothetical protein